MELNFREYAEAAWGPGLGALGGWLAGGGTPLSWPLAALGGYAGHRAQQWYQDLMDPAQRYHKVDPRYFVYYRDIDGKIQKELLPNVSGYDKEATLLHDPQAEHKNNDKNHPYFYYFDDRKNKIVKRIKAGYQAFQRRSRYHAGGYGQQRGYQYRGRQQRGY